MHIAIIGGGITGLVAAYQLTKKGHSVTIYEKTPVIGGLAQGFRAPSWAWSIESTYHHIFTNDTEFLRLAKELSLQNSLLPIRPVTANYYNNTTFQFDSAWSLLSAPFLSISDKLKTAFLIGSLKITPFWKPLESIRALPFIRFVGGSNASRVIWEPLLVGKFGSYASQISASWFWARIKKRTPTLIYMKGGFRTFITALAKYIRSHGGIIRTNQTITSISAQKNAWRIQSGKLSHLYDGVIITTPTKIAESLCKTPLLHPKYAAFRNTNHLHAQVLIVETDTPILKETYWLNILDRTFPFLAAVAHTNFVDNKHYGGSHLTYFGNYLEETHPFLAYSQKKLLGVFLPFIKKIAKTKRITIKRTYLFTAPYAQPVHTKGYSRTVPPLTTMLPNVILANMDHIVPWDRGMNYAVELGNRATHVLLAKRKKQ